MSIEYRRNVIRFLEDQDRYFQRGTCLRLAIQAAGDAIFGTGTPAQHLARARQTIATTARKWLNSTVLMAALRRSLES